MRTDCNTCPVRGIECDDCIVPVLLQFAPPAPLDDRPSMADPLLDNVLDHRESAVLAMLADVGLVTDVDVAHAVVSTGVGGLRSVG